MTTDIYANGHCKHCRTGVVALVKPLHPDTDHWQCNDCDSTYVLHEYEPLHEKEIKDISEIRTLLEMWSEHYHEMHEDFLKYFTARELLVVTAWTEEEIELADSDDELINKIIKQFNRVLNDSRAEEVRELTEKMKAISGDGGLLVDVPAKERPAPFNLSPSFGEQSLENGANIIVENNIFPVGASETDVMDEDVYANGIEEGEVLVQEYNDDETELLFNHLTIVKSSLYDLQLDMAEHIAQKFVQVGHITVHAEEANESYLSQGATPPLYRVTLTQDVHNIGVPTPEEQVNELAEYINANCPEEIDMDGGAVDIAMAIIYRYMDTKQRLDSVYLLADRSTDFDTSVLQAIRGSQHI